jgi:hypothetical protein
MKVLVTSKRLAGYATRLADLEPPTNSERVRATLRGKALTQNAKDPLGIEEVLEGQGGYKGVRAGSA